MQSYLRLTIAAGLVHIPVALHSTKDSTAGLQFKTLTDCCSAPVKQQWTCSKCKAVAPSTHKGWPVGGSLKKKDVQYVEVTQDEQDSLKASQDTGCFQVLHYAPAAAVAEEYIEKSYWLQAPEQAEAYLLLHSAMQAKGLVAVGTYTDRGKQYCGYLQAAGIGLTLFRTAWPDHMKDACHVWSDDYRTQQHKKDLAPALLELTGRMLDSQTQARPVWPTNTQEQALKAALEQKAATGQAVALPAAKAADAPADLLQALKASLELAETGGK